VTLEQPRGNSPVRYVLYTYLGKTLPTSYTDSFFSLKDSSLSIQYTYYSIIRLPIYILTLYINVNSLK